MNINTYKHGSLFSCVLLFALALFWVLGGMTYAKAQTPPKYTVTPLGSFAPTSINNNSVIAGNDANGLVWRQGRITRLQQGSFVTSINDTDNACGWINDAYGRPQATLWTPTQRIQLAGGAPIRAFSINNNGDIVGRVNIPVVAKEFAVEWLNYNASIVDPLGNYFLTGAQCINNSGHIAGFEILGYSSSFGFFYTGSDSLRLFRLPYTDGCTPYGINDKDQVVGLCFTSGNQQAFLWQASTRKTIPLPPLAPGANCCANAINNDGVIVGYADDINGRSHAVIWLPNDQGAYMNIVDLAQILNKNGWDFGANSSCTAINTGGQIVGTASLNGQQQGFLLTGNYIKVVSARLHLGDDLEVKIIRDFGSSLPNVKFTLTVGGKDYEHTERTLHASPFPSSVNLNLADMGIPRFNENTKITVRASATLSDGAITDQREMLVLLPVVLIPGIDPRAFYDGYGMGGDGTFAKMEAALKENSNALLQSGKFLGEGYYTQIDRTDPADPSILRDYPTIYTLGYDRNNASFNEGAGNLLALINRIKATTYADRVNIATHSKGGLVARAYLSYAAFDKSGATVKQLIMAEPPNLGSLWAKFDFLSAIVQTSYNYRNLLPTYPWFRYLPTQKYAESPNPELSILNQQTLPAKVTYTIMVGKGNVAPGLKTPQCFTAVYFNGFPLTLYLATSFTDDGDGIVTTFSQSGKMFDPNNPTAPVSLIPAFQGIEIHNVLLAGGHIGFFDQHDVQQEIFSELTSDLK